MLYYLKDGTPITLEEWARLFDMRIYKQVGYTLLGDEGEEEFVSTVWLGLNHRFGDGPPLIFETMARYHGDWQECERYSTEAEAIAGHRAMVEMLRRSGLRIRTTEIMTDSFERIVEEPPAPTNPFGRVLETDL